MSNFCKSSQAWKERLQRACTCTFVAFIHSFIHSLLYTVEPRLTDTPEKRPSTILRTLHLVPNVFTYVCVQSKPLNCRTPRKVDRFPSPNSTWTVQNSVDNPDTCFCKIVQHIWWIQRPGIISINIVAYCANFSQPCTAMERSENAPWSYSPHLSIHCKKV